MGVEFRPMRDEEFADWLPLMRGNEVARSLYRSLGYDENAVAMSKRV